MKTRAVPNILLPVNGTNFEHWFVGVVHENELIGKGLGKL